VGVSSLYQMTCPVNQIHIIQYARAARLLNTVSILQLHTDQIHVPHRDCTGVRRHCRVCVLRNCMGWFGLNLAGGWQVRKFLAESLQCSELLTSSAKNWNFSFLRGMRSIFLFTTPSPTFISISLFSFHEIINRHTGTAVKQMHSKSSNVSQVES